MFYIFEIFKSIRQNKETAFFQPVPCHNYSTAVEMLRREPEIYKKTTGDKEQDSRLIADYENAKLIEAVNRDLFLTSDNWE